VPPEEIKLWPLRETLHHDRSGLLPPRGLDNVGAGMAPMSRPERRATLFDFILTADVSETRGRKRQVTEKEAKIFFISL
jgi:hypothetical protein